MNITDNTNDEYELRKVDGFDAIEILMHQMQILCTNLRLLPIGVRDALNGALNNPEAISQFEPPELEFLSGISRFMDALPRPKKEVN